MKDEHEIIRLARPVDESDHTLGLKSAAATLVEYGDYECPYCRELHPLVQEILNRTEGLCFVYRHFPINNLHPHAARAAEAAEGAGAQGRFWEMHDALFEEEQTLDDKRLSRLARKVGLDMQRYEREMSRGDYRGKVEEDFKAALYQEGVTGTPTLYLNGLRLSRIHSIEELLWRLPGRKQNMTGCFRPSPSACSMIASTESSTSPSASASIWGIIRARS